MCLKIKTLFKILPCIPDCYECEKMYIDPCPTHPILWIKSVKPLLCDAVETEKPEDCCCGKDERNHSRRTAPEPFVHVGRSCIKGAGLGVWAEKDIPLGAIFGPYTGEIVPLENISDQELKKVIAICGSRFIFL